MRNLLLIASALILFGSCDPARPNRVSEVRRMTGGDPSEGREKVLKYGCQACHTVPGVQGANALVGPPLTHWSKRVYIAGELPNTSDNLIKWLQHPTSIEPKTAMPEMGVTDQDSRDIAAYLFMLD